MLPRTVTVLLPGQTAASRTGGIRAGATFDCGGCHGMRQYRHDPARGPGVRRLAHAMSVVLLENEDVAWFRDDLTGARLAASRLAVRIGLSEHRAAEVALAVSEAASNLVKHALHGAIVLRLVRTDQLAGVEFLAVDSGPGMADWATTGHNATPSAGHPTWPGHGGKPQPAWQITTLGHCRRASRHKPEHHCSRRPTPVHPQAAAPVGRGGRPAPRDPGSTSETGPGLGSPTVASGSYLSPDQSPQSDRLGQLAQPGRTVPRCARHAGEQPPRRRGNQLTVAVSRFSPADAGRSLTVRTAVIAPGPRPITFCPTQTPPKSSHEERSQACRE
jgi:Histidine kinase-like ATPase domain